MQAFRRFLAHQASPPMGGPTPPPLLLPAPTGGRMEQRRLRIGLAGAGHFGRFHALKAAAAPRAMLAGIFDPDTARAGKLAAEAGSRAIGWEALLADCDAVVVAAPAEVH